METIEFVKKRVGKNEKELKTSKFNISDVCIEISVVVFACFMTYFMVMRAVGLHEVFILRYLNSLFLFGGILLALHSYKKSIKDNINYKKGLQIGMLITLISVIPFAVFIYLYLSTDDGFMNLVKNNTDIKEFVSPIVIAGFICIEGLCSGSIITFILMQYFRKKENNV